MYRYLRNELKVPFIGNSTIATPSVEKGGFNWGVDGAEENANKGATMGGMTTKVFESMRNGDIYHVIMGCISDVENIAATKAANIRLALLMACSAT
jgi:hypothetical protein